MRFYRVCTVDAADHIEDIRLIEASSEQEALAIAATEAAAGTIAEVWDQRRLIGRTSGRLAAAMPFPLPMIDEAALAT